MGVFLWYLTLQNVLACLLHEKCMELRNRFLLTLRTSIIQEEQLIEEDNNGLNPVLAELLMNCTVRDMSIRQEQLLGWTCINHR